jgi:hypothetical protein
MPVVLALGGCETGGYYGGGVAYGGGYPYDGYYDGYYGPIDTGYWGNDGYFYYRSHPNEQHFHRGDHEHFSRQAGNGGNWQQMHGSFQPSHGAHMPNFPHGDQKGGHHGGDRPRH